MSIAENRLRMEKQPADPPPQPAVTNRSSHHQDKATDNGRRPSYTDDYY
jgi:hypothetical protein